MLGHRLNFAGRNETLGVSKETCELSSFLITNLRSHRCLIPDREKYE